MTPICLKTQYETWMPATLEDVDSVCQCLRAFLLQAKLETRLFDVILVAREALVNAVMHGCGVDRRKTIRLLVWLNDKEIITEIEDPGDGFDWRKQMNVKAALADTSGRGLSILAGYCKRYEYNDKGNKIRLYQPMIR